jgi:hypothetical protein
LVSDSIVGWKGPGAMGKEGTAADSAAGEEQTRRQVATKTKVAVDVLVFIGLFRLLLLSSVRYAPDTDQYLVAWFRTSG